MKPQNLHEIEADEADVTANETLEPRLGPRIDVITEEPREANFNVFVESKLCPKTDVTAEDPLEPDWNMFDEDWCYCQRSSLT